MGHPILHIELPAQDHNELAHWYARHFGWKTRTWPEVGYTTASWGDQPGTGVGFGPENAARPSGSVLCYIDSEDVEADSKAIQADGATILSDKMTVPGVGTIVWFKDPAGNPMALLQSEVPEEDD
jgi:predicted enzyme related to lactoylglutathione lyase